MGWLVAGCAAKPALRAIAQCNLVGLTVASGTRWTFFGRIDTPPTTGSFHRQVSLWGFKEGSKQESERVRERESERVRERESERARERESERARERERERESERARERESESV
jgi:hypothetical protein